jgi:hypothetical protein
VTREARLHDLSMNQSTLSRFLNKYHYHGEVNKLKICKIKFNLSIHLSIRLSIYQSIFMDISIKSTFYI